MQRRPNFSVAASVVVLLVVFAFLASFVRPLIPPPPPNRIASYPGDFLSQAAGQAIGWNPLEPTAFAEARRLDRPVLLVVGVAWSQNGRELDSDVFSNSDVVNYLSHNYVCIRVDAAEMPAWATGYLPLSRAPLGIRPRLQVWVLEPDGTLISNIGRRHAETILDANQFLQELVKIRDAYTQLRQTGQPSDLEAQQNADMAEIEAVSPLPWVDFGAMATAIKSASDPRYGGFPVNGFQDVQPYAWQYLAMVGQKAQVRASLLPALRSPIVDLMDGGFFVTARGPSWMTVEFDKAAARNAEMACTLAESRSCFSDPSDVALCDYVLKRDLDSLEHEFSDPTGFIRAARIGDENDDGRSARTSVLPKRMREVLSPQEREWARKHLGLRVETNPQMVPFLPDATALERVEAIRSKLGSGLPAARFSSGLYMDVNGTVAARMLETGRATSDSAVIDFASSLFDRLDAERVDDQVPHDLEYPGRTSATALDFLGYSDAALQDFLATGRVPSLQHGLAVLQRALVNFEGSTPGEFRMSAPPSSGLIPSNYVGPEVVDDFGESASAKVVRLCCAYGRVLVKSGKQNDPGFRLLQTAYATENLLAQPATAIGLQAAAFGCASLTMADDEYAVAVGLDAVDLANRLFALRPTRFVAPAIDPVSLAEANLQPGIYIVRKGVPSGPYSLKEASDRLSPTLSPGP